MSDVLADYDVMTDADREQYRREEIDRLKIPKGVYEGQFVDSKTFVSESPTFAKSGAKDPYYRIPVVSLQFQLFDVPTADGFGTRTAKDFYRISDAKVTDESGRRGMATINWLKLTDALGLGNVPAQDVAAKLVNGPRLRFTVGDKGYVNKIEAA
jgi:hypothetical protein